MKNMTQNHIYLACSVEISSLQYVSSQFWWCKWTLKKSRIITFYVQFQVINKFIQYAEIAWENRVSACWNLLNDFVKLHVNYMYWHRKFTWNICIFWLANKAKKHCSMRQIFFIGWFVHSHFGSHTHTHSPHIYTRICRQKEHCIVHCCQPFHVKAEELKSNGIPCVC